MMIGSITAGAAHGVMIGLYIVGFRMGWPEIGFALFTGLALGATWLIVSTYCRYAPYNGRAPASCCARSKIFWIKARESSHSR
jgi:hypothetical protein